MEWKIIANKNIGRREKKRRRRGKKKRRGVIAEKKRGVKVTYRIAKKEERKGKIKIDLEGKA